MNRATGLATPDIEQVLELLQFFRESAAKERPGSEVLHRCAAALDSLLAFYREAVEALDDTLAWIDEVGAEAKRRDTERLDPHRAVLAKARAVPGLRG